MPDKHPEAITDASTTGEQLSRFFSACLGQPFVDGNEVRILRNGDNIFPAMLKAIDDAQETIEFLTYVYWKGEIAIEFARRLSAAAQRGVIVRVLLDSHGARTMENTARQLLAQHCQLRWFRPLRVVRFWQNFKRTHRKIMVCDGKLAFTGGIGIASQWTGNAENPDNWRETHFAIRGPCVKPIRAAFADNWLETRVDDTELLTQLAKYEHPPVGDQAIMVVAATANDFWSRSGTLLLTAITAAQSCLRITTPYFVPDNRLKQSLIAARQRDVKIKIIIPDAQRSDSKLAALAAHGSLAELVNNGIEIYTYQPTLIHTKCIIVDDQIAIIGSVNFNQRSQRKDDEISLLINKGQTVAQLVTDFNDDIEHTIEMDANKIRKRSGLLTTAAQMIQPFRRNL